ncbi:uncharacterized protein LOC142231517 [Haematobia irritans]|uniref:uncharacterized protein LOC142231517 n=1 Tax=Haematobia irritans TaxID=7368 RepID=UPI003F505A47
MTRCHLCNIAHLLKYCKFFLALHVDLRWRTLEKNKICTNCLAQTHTADGCFSLYRCRYCGAKHHSLLHVHPAGYEEKQAKALAATDDRRPKAKNQYRLLNPESPIHVAPLIRTTVTHGDCEATMTILVRTESKHSAMLYSATSKFPEFTQSKGPTGEPVCEVAIHTMESTVRGKLLLIDAVSYELPEAIGDTRLRAHFDFLVPLAHDNFHNENEIDIILGSYSWEKLKKPAVIKQDTSLPIAQASLFGWVISGTWVGCACLQHEGRDPIALPR